MTIPERLKKSGVRLPVGDVKRSVVSDIIPWIGPDEVIIITGARQTGKTILLFQLIRDILLKKTGRIYYINLDVKDNLKKIQNTDYIVNIASGSKKKSYILIDEIQRIKEPGLFLKGIYDLHLPVKLIVSGSSALEIKSKIHEPLTGRKQVFHISPFNCEETMAALFHGKNYTDILRNPGQFQTVLDHLSIYGSYPAVVTTRDKDIKLGILKEIYTSYMEKDIKAFLNVENETAFSNLVKILASQVGSLLNKNELASSIGVHKNTLDKYLFYLEQTYTVDFVYPFFKNARKELLKSPKIFFSDLGLRNMATGYLENKSHDDKGHIFENLVYLMLKNKMKGTEKINYWRTKAGAEVDFIIGGPLKPIPVEVKSGSLKSPQISRGFRSFLQAYKPEYGYYINGALNCVETIENSKIYFITPGRLATEELIKY